MLVRRKTAAPQTKMNEQPPAYETIIGPIEDRMIRSIWRIVRDAHDAEDVMQNALATIWKRWNRVCGHESPQALVLKICSDAAYDFLRRRHREKSKNQRPIIEPLDSARMPYEEMTCRETQADIVAAIGRLSRRQAVAFTLRVFEDLPYRDIASSLGCAEATARKHVERARAHLRVALARHEPNRLAGGGA